MTEGAEKLPLGQFRKEKWFWRNEME